MDNNTFKINPIEPEKFKKEMEGMTEKIQKQREDDSKLSQIEIKKRLDESENYYNKAKKSGGEQLANPLWKKNYENTKDRYSGLFDEKKYNEELEAEVLKTPEGRAKKDIKDKAAKSEKTFEDLQKQTKDLTAEQGKFRDEQIKEAEKLTKWYSGLSTDYKDYVGKMKDEVKEVEKEYDVKKEKLQSQHYANVGMMSQASLAGMRGRATTGSQRAVAMATAQRSAGDDYANAMNRMESMQAQKEQVALQMASSALNMQMSAVQTGAGIQSNQIAMKANAQNAYTQSTLQGIAVTGQLEQSKFEAGTLSSMMDIQQASHDRELQNNLMIAQIQANGASNAASSGALGETLMTSASLAGTAALLSGGNPLIVAGAAITGALLKPDGLKKLPIIGSLFD